VLQRVAACCSVLQCVAERQMQSQSVRLQLPVRHCALCCSVMQCDAACCSVLQRVAVCCRAANAIAKCAIAVAGAIILCGEIDLSLR